MIKNFAGFLTKQAFNKNIYKSFSSAAALGCQKTGEHIQGDLSQLQKVPIDFIHKGMISQAFKHYEDQISVYKYPEQQLPEGFQNTKNCFQYMHIPLSTQKNFQDGFIRYDKQTIRLGKLLELFDLIAGDLGYQFINDNYDDATVVTACVDNIKFEEQISPYKDLHINAYPSYVGSSSIEIQIDLYQRENETDNDPLELRCTSAFLMVARQAQDNTKSFKLPKFSIETEQEQQLFNQGVTRQMQRKQKKNESLYKKSPNQYQIESIHKFFMNQSKYENDKQQYKQIDDTKLQKILPMHFQDKNVHGLIFGGYIIREAFELGYLSAIMLNKGTVPRIKYIDDFQFIKAVQIGDILRFQSEVTCVVDNQAFVTVECSRMGYDYEPIEKTNELQLIFEVNQDAKQVYPVTYASAMKYLNGYSFIKQYQQNC